MKCFHQFPVVFILLLSLLASMPSAPAQAQGACISLTALGSGYNQNFNTLSNAAGSTNNNLTIPGWYLTETGGGARDNEQYAVDTGGSNTGDMYSYGANGDTERALGGVRSGTLIPIFGACFTNNTGSTIASLDVAYTGEEWRLGTAVRTDQINFEYSTNAASLVTGTWTAVPALNFVTPDIGITGAKNGNAAAERTARSSTINGVVIPNGSTFWIRWTDTEASGADDGLAVDDFSLTPQGIVLPNLSISDASLHEGNSGNTTLTFTVSLSSSAPAGGVTFDIATANNSAVAPGDYTAKSLTGQTIPAGSSTYIFDVLVNGDPLAESDETFFVDVTNVTGANVTDGQGLGTINNDDTTITVATSGSPSGFGSTVTFTATVTEPGAGTPTGAVEFFDGGISLGTGTLVGGQAIFSTTSLAVGSHTITATYLGDVNFGGSTSPGLTQVVEGLPSVLQLTDNFGGVILENGHTSAAINQLLVVFSKDMNAADAQTLANYSLVRDGSTVITINSITYAAQTATLTVNAPLPLPNGKYTLTVEGGIRDTLMAPIGTDFVRVFYVDNGAPILTSVITVQNDAAIVDGATINVGFSSLDITFNEDVSNPAGNTDPDDVTNSANYLLVILGANGAFDTPSCAAGLTGDDVQISTGPITYSNGGGGGPFVATVQLNNGTTLPNGLYRLYVCGTTSIVDLAGNPLNNGADDQRTFTVLVTAAGTGSSARRNPQTGFAPDVVTLLPEQPAAKAYADLGDLWLEIPTLKLKTSITGVPLTADGWDVTWLNRQVGWLEGTAYPTWEGNTVLTAHGYTADGEAGPFALLKDLSYGETIVIHLGGMKYTYALRANLLIRPSNTYWLTRHEKLDWVTLITCQQYDEKTKSYRYRRVVRAVLVKVEEE
jgi:LPXTG-site transpeptidase (sortase) family protein